jgi:hypothetical protein
MFKQVQRAGKNVEKCKIKVTDIGLVDTQLEEGDLHSLFSDNKQLIDDDSHLDDQEYKTADTQVDINPLLKKNCAFLFCSVFLFSANLNIFPNVSSFLCNSRISCRSRCNIENCS